MSDFRSDRFMANLCRKVHFEDAPGGANGDKAVKGMEPFTEDQYDP